MIELPEARTISSQLRKEILDKSIIDVSGNFTDHKFTFYYGDPNEYKSYLIGKKVTDIVDRNYYIEIKIEDYTVIMRDGANIRYYKNENDLPKKSKLLIKFDDNSFLNVTTSMYAFIAVFKNNETFDDKYYNIELSRVGALDNKFTFSYFKSLINEETLNLSIKAFLATEQRILGIGNGVVQDIMFYANLHPKRKINTLSDEDITNLYNAVVNTLKEMVVNGGRDTEKDIYDKNGNYKVVLSSKTYKNPCKICGYEIIKEQYLGGSIYYCSNCQK